jgi:DNA-binding transcriptional LysR family regulator
MGPLAAFQALHPRVQVQLAVNNGFLNLTQREADLAVRGSNRPPDNLIGRNVGCLQTALYASQDYLRSHGRDAGDPGHAWVAPDESLNHLDSARWIAKHVPVERIAFRCDNLPALADAVAGGMGVGFLLCHLADARPGLVRLQPPLPSMDTQLWVLTHPALKQVTRVRALADFLVEHLRADSRLRYVPHPGRAGGRR